MERPTHGRGILPDAMTAPSIFSATDLDAVLRRIGRLASASQREWGKMDAAQALAHCQVPLRVALGEVKLKRGLIGILFGGMAKKSLLRDEPFKHGMPTDKAFRVRDPRVFATERDRLVALVTRLGRGGPGVLTTEPHPFFGALSPAEWDTLMWKHLDHHLRQFGV